MLRLVVLCCDSATKPAKINRRSMWLLFDRIALKQSLSYEAIDVHTMLLSFSSQTYYLHA